MNPSNRDEELIPHGRETIAVEQGGVDEVSVVPWTAMIPRKVARRIGLTRKWATLIVVLAGLFTTSSTITVLSVSLKTIAGDLHSTTSILTWAITGPMLAFGVVGPAYGKIGDLYGHKKVYVGGLFFAGVFAFLTVFAWNGPTMVLFRLLSATAGSATGPAAMAYINRLFEPHERVRPMGLWSFTTAGAPVLGVVIGGPLVESIGWRMIFIIQTPLLLGASVLAWSLLPQTSRLKNVKFDVSGSATLGSGATFLLLAINRGHAWGWGSPAIIAFFVVSVLSFVAFVRVEKRAEAPLMPLSWLSNANLFLPMVIQSLINFAYMGGFVVIPQMLEDGLHMTPSHIGLLVIARPLTFSLTAPLASFFTMRVGERVSGVLGATGVIASMVLLSTIRGGAADIVVIMGLGLSGIGFGIAGPALSSLVSNNAPEDAIGVAGAMQQLLSQMGAVLGSTVMISIHEMTAGSGMLTSYGYALLAGAFTSVVGMVLSFKLVPTDRSAYADR